MKIDKDRRLALKSKTQQVQLNILMLNEASKSKSQIAQFERTLGFVTACILLTITAYFLLNFGLDGAMYIAITGIAITLTMFVVHSLYLQNKAKNLQTVLDKNIDMLLDANKTTAPPVAHKKPTPKPSVKMLTYEKLDTNFLNDYKELKGTYNNISDNYSRYKASDLDERQSEYADNLMAVSNKVINQLKTSYELNGGEVNMLTPYILPADHALAKLRGVHKELTQAIRRKNLQIASDLENMVLPEYLVLEHTFEDLTKRSAHLLEKIKIDPLYKHSEDKVILTKIVGHRLDELWTTYLEARKDGSVGERGQHPDQVLSEIFTEISGFIDRLEEGVNDYQKTQAMNNLLTDKRYFKDRFS